MKTISSYRSRLLAVALLALGAAATQARADDLFDGIKPRAFSEGAALSPDATIGGYPIYQGDGNWRIFNVSKVATNRFGVSYGSVRLTQSRSGVYFAELVTTANLNRSGMEFYLTGDNCSGSHLVKINKPMPGRGDSAWDNCLTIDPFVVEVQRKSITTLRSRVTQSREGNRYYQLDLVVNPAALGFGASLPSDWSANAVAADPAKKLFLEKLTTWASQLQNAADDATAWSRPKDAFKQVISMHSMRSGDNSSASAAAPAPVLVAAAQVTTDTARTPPVAKEGLRVGDSLRFVDRDAISGVSIGDSFYSIDRIDAASITFNGGAMKLRPDGTPDLGQMGSSYVYQYDGAARRSTARFKVDGLSEAVMVQMERIGSMTMSISGVALQVSTFAIRGRASYEKANGGDMTAKPAVGADFAGEIVIDDATGLTVSIKSRSKHEGYNLVRELVAIGR